MYNCRLTNEPLKEIIDLGNQFVSDFVPKEAVTNGERSSLKVGIGPTGLVQFYDAYDPVKMYRKYWYKSSVNDSMRASLESLVRDVLNFPGLKMESDDIFCDIASNDGQMLSSDLLKGYIKVGIDPSDVAGKSSIYKENDITLVNNFFSKEAYFSVCGKKAKVITIIAMFYDIEQPVKFLQEVEECLDEEGLLCLQLSYTPLMVEQLAYDNFCAEHLMYYTFDTLNQVMKQSGFKIVDAELNSVNAGSLRVYAVKSANNRNKVPTHTKLVEEARLKGIVEYEKTVNLTYEGWKDFGDRVNKANQNLINFLKEAKEEGKLVIGYAASTKANTILQTCNITSELLPYIAERSTDKFGLYTVGTGIPIISEEEMRKLKPDYLLVLAYTFVDFFLEREAELRSQGTKLVCPLPELKIYE